jgi:hypothetical protein
MTAHAASGQPRRGSVISTVPSEDLAALDLPGLRDYRHRLEAEEDKVSYWRRLAHARIDVLEAQSGHHGMLAMADLVRVLGDTASGQSRRALVSVKPADPLPELPQLDEMWGTHLDPDDDAQTTAAVEGLRTAEQQLTDYRHALHERIDEATRELILRYRADPRAALTLIPKE